MSKVAVLWGEGQSLRKDSAEHRGPPALPAAGSLKGVRCRGGVWAVAPSVTVFPLQKAGDPLSTC